MGNVSFVKFMADIVKQVGKVETKYDLEFYQVNIQMRVVMLYSMVYIIQILIREKAISSNLHICRIKYLDVV